MLHKVNVTQAHIDRGRAGSCNACPVVRAIAAHFNVGGIMILPTSMFTYTLYGLNGPIALPNVVGKFIHAFDSRRPVAPFEFELEVPDAKVQTAT